MYRRLLGTGGPGCNSLNYDSRSAWFPRFPLPPPPKVISRLLFLVSYLLFLSVFSLPLSSAGPFVSGSAYVLFVLFSPFLIWPIRFCFVLVCLGKTGRICTVVVFGLLSFLASFSSPPCLVGISRLRHSPLSRGRRRPRSRPEPPILLLCGVAPCRAIDSGLAILSWADGRLHPRWSRLLLGFAWVGRTGAEPLSGPRSSRRARDLTMCPCASDA